MKKGAVTISIDVELAWGNWDNLTRESLENVEQKERLIVAKLIEILERHEVPATWAIVAGLLDPVGSAGRSGSQHCWYAPDVVEAITASSVRHDIGSHGGRHIYLDAVSSEEANEDLDFARDTYRENGLTCTSFVFPRNKVGNKAIVARHGFQVYRGEDLAWHQRIRSRQPLAGRLANLVDKMLPIAPKPVQPLGDCGMINLPGSMLFMSRNGLRSFARTEVIRTKLQKGIAAAIEQDGVFHLWFHPSNFYHQSTSQFAIFEGFVSRLNYLASRDRLEVKTMASFAQR